MKQLDKFILVIVLVALHGCSDINQSFTDGYDENPNLPTDAPLENTFTASQAAMIVLMEGHTPRLTSMWTRHATGGERQYQGYHSYNVTSDALSFGNSWELAYNDVLSNVKLTQLKGEEQEGRDNILAVSKILEAVTIGTVTALWGDVPYSQALKPNETLSPEVNDQASIYSDVQQLLDEAITTLENNPQDLATGVDIFSYEGDAVSWLRAAYTLKARFYMHVGNYEGAILAAENGIQAVDGSEDLNFVHGTTYQGNMNLWYSFMENDRVGYLSATDNQAFPLMEGRQSIQTVETGRMSFYYNEDGDDLNTNDAFAENADYSFLTAGETYLILAEANQKVDESQDVVINYLNSARDYNENRYPNSTYGDLAASDFGFDDDAILQEIYDETYLSLFFQIEAYNFARRIDWQVTGLEPVGSQDNFPERFLYPTSEQNANSNLPSQTNADLFTPTPVNE